MAKILLALLLLGLCNQSSADVSVAQIDSLLSGIKSVASSDLSCKSQSDCDSLAAGSRACGGPNEFIIVSKNNVALDALTKLVEIEAQVESQYNMEVGGASICSMEMPPKVMCEKNMCKQDNSF